VLIQDDSNELGDKRLSPEEAIFQERELSLNMAAKKKIWRQQELEDPARSAGPRLYYTEILRRLWKLNPDLRVEEGSNGQIAIYRLKRYDEYDWEQFDPLAPTKWRWDFEYVAGLPKEWIPEYPHVALDTSNLPTREIHGWRSTLIALIKARAITYRGAIQEFGDPENDQRSGRWFEYLSKYMYE
jgi:hypothetical protein